MLLEIIREIHHMSRRTYGARRVHAELVHGRGVAVARCTVELVMRRNNGFGEVSSKDTSLLWGVESALLLKRSSGLSSSGDDALGGLLIEVARAEEANERDEQRVTEFPESVMQRRRHTARRVGFF